MSTKISFVESLVDPHQISYQDSDRKERSTDWGTNDADGVMPDVVVWPESTADVAEVMSAANEHGIPVTPYASGTSLEGNAVPVNNGITLDMSRMDAILEIRPDDLQADIQPSVLGDELDSAAREYGLTIPALPASGSIATIGGMIANDASGTKAVKYGEIADWVLELEAVLPTGDIVTFGSKAAKTSAGYNLKDLMIGSEGTLGIITRATVKLTSHPNQISGGRAMFDDINAATNAIIDAVQSGVDVAKIELIDAFSAEVSNEYLDTTLPNIPMVFVEFHANHNIEDEVEICRDIFEKHNVREFEVSEADEGMDELWEARSELANAFEPYDPELSPLTPGDITVPISNYSEIVSYAKHLGDEYGLPVATFGHAGDGNVHYIILVDPDDHDSIAAGETISKRLVERTIELNGTSTGEHGVGTGKREYLLTEHEPATLDAMRSIKNALDPNNILNPDKIFFDN